MNLLDKLSATVHVGTVKHMTPYTGELTVIDDNMYFVEGISPEAASKTRVKDEDIIQKSHFCIDLDIRSKEPDIPDSEIVKIAACLQEDLNNSVSVFENWSYIVFTGNGLHIHYLGDTVPINHKEWADGMEVVLQSFTEKVGYEEYIDRSTKNASRLWRVIGSYNCKGEKKLVETIFSQEKKFDISLVCKAATLKEKKKENTFIHKLISASSGDGYEKIQKVPIQELVCKVKNWQFDGRNFQDIGKKDNKGLFKPETGNYIVLTGTPHIDQSKNGYRPFEYIKQEFKFNNAQVFDWFKEHYKIQGSKVKPSHFVSWKDLCEEAKQSKFNLTKEKIMTFDLEPLDDELGGIIPTDLIVIAAPTGQGKSELLMNIAAKNSKTHNVVYYQLEMDNTSPVDRMVLRLYNERVTDRNFISAKQFRCNNITEKQRAEVDKIYDEIGRMAENMAVYSGDALDFHQFTSTFAAAEGIDLIVLDHLHYFSMDDLKSQSENLGIVMRGIRQIVKNRRIPVVCASHLRKPQSKTEEPTLHDLFGSSNIAKEATNIIMLYTHNGQSIIKIEKSRDTGVQTKWTAEYDPYRRKLVNIQKDEAQEQFNSFNDDKFKFS